MTALDIFTLLLVGTAGILGLKRGLVTEILSLSAWVVAAFAVKLGHGPLTDMLAAKVGTDAGAALLAFALLFGGVFLATRYVARMIGNHTKESFVGGFDRILGFGFGLLKGLLGATIGFALVVMVYDTIYTSAAERPAWMKDSQTYPLLNATSGALVAFIAERRSKQAEDASKASTAAP
jgi:membrane protein required for colicin V production